MPLYALVILGAGWVLWMLPFLLMKRPGTPARIDRRARWGMLLEGVAYAMLWSGPFWMRPVEPWQAALTVSLFLLGSLLSWTATRTLGRQWRIDAGLNDDHQLVRSGPYRFVRHPIYASMFAMLLGTGFTMGSWIVFPIAVVIFLFGTEIRVRVEDALLTSRFGDQARAYQRTTAAYIPGIR